MTYGEMLVMLMSERNMSQAELARRTGISKQNITELVKGRTREPTFSNAMAFANALGISLDEMAQMVSSSGDAN